MFELLSTICEDIVEARLDDIEEIMAHVPEYRWLQFLNSYDSNLIPYEALTKALQAAQKVNSKF
jgi:hypothetical protein